MDFSFPVLAPPKQERVRVFTNITGQKNKTLCIQAALLEQLRSSITDIYR